MSKRTRTSFELTDITEKILQELKHARWDYTEVINSGIVAFSQLNDEQKRFFRSTAYGLDNSHSENAREIFRKWILELVADAQATDAKKKHSRRAKPAKSG